MLTVSLTTMLSASPSFAGKPGWLLRQNSQTYGIVQTVVSPDGLRLEMGDIKVAMRPPEWRVTFWNVRTHFTYDETIEQFQKRIPQRKIPEGWLRKVVPAEPYEETLAGIKGKHYQWISYDPKNPNRRGVLYDYVCTENLGLPKKLNEVASICCYVPPGKGLPLKVSGIQKILYLQTTMASKTTVDAGIFKVPKGYTRVKSEMDVLMKEPGTAGDEDVSDLFKAIPKHR